MRHRHDIEGGYIIHEDHDLGEGARSLDPIPYEGHQHIMALISRNYVHEISGPAYRDPCPSKLAGGPGHQSVFPCELADDGHHDHEESAYGYTWSTCHEREDRMAFTSYFDAPPGQCDEDDHRT